MIFRTAKNVRPIIPVTPQKPEEGELYDLDYYSQLVDTCKKVERENDMHKKKLLEICESYSEDEVKIACAVFARMYPDVMYDALRDEHKNMSDLVSGLRDLNSSYQRKVNEL